MKTIIEGKPTVEKLLGKQRPKDTLYRLMKYTLCEKCKEGALLHNSITGRLVLLNDSEAEILSKVPVSSSEVIHALIEHHYLVPLHYDEQATVDTLRRMMRNLFTPKGINGYTIMTTTNCNARCFYCYQANYRHITMTEETAEQLVCFMMQHRGEDPLHIQWFGGEPLVGIARIDQISAKLKNNNLSFSSSMITNGFLFTEEIVERAVKLWELRNVQITLDGTEDIYNKTKSFAVNCHSPYKRVLRNINLLLEHGIRVGIRLNLDQHNETDLYKLVEEITNQIPNKKYLNVYAKVVYENEGYEPIVRTEEKQHELYETQFQLNKTIFDAGLCRVFYSLPSLKHRSCMADNPRSVVVYPDGRLFNCEHTGEGDCFGNIESSETDESISTKFSIPMNKIMCHDCPLYPSCLILKACEGARTRNSTTCSYEVRMKALAIMRQYELSPSSEFQNDDAEETENFFKGIS